MLQVIGVWVRAYSPGNWLVIPGRGCPKREKPRYSVSFFLNSMDMNIIHQGNSIITMEVLPNYSQSVVIKKPSGRGMKELQSKKLNYLNICFK
jgi:hypothetical protein